MSISGQGKYPLWRGIFYCGYENEHFETSLLCIHLFLTNCSSLLNIFSPSIIFFSSPLRRLSEQSRMLADHKRPIGDLNDQYADARDWNLRYKAAFKGIHGSELGACINAIQKPLELGEEMFLCLFHCLCVLPPFIPPSLSTYLPT